MPGSCKVILNKMVYKGAMTVEERDKILRNLIRHGKWVGTEFDGYADGNPVYYEWKCSVCGCVFEDDEPTYRYCPNCGARMESE